jgi:hypothetical protein
VPERRGSEAGLVALPAVRMKREDEDADYRYTVVRAFFAKILIVLAKNMAYFKEDSKFGNVWQICENFYNFQF